MGAVIFDASSGTKHITSSGASIFSDITFNDGGGGASWILEDNLVVKDPVNINSSRLTITSGILDVNASENNAINLEGSWINDGTFLARNGTVILDNDAAQSGTITSGSSPFYDLTINPSAAATYTLEDTLELNNNLTISTGTLDTKLGENNSIRVKGNWTNSSTFLARNSTVTFDDDQANSRTITSGGTSFYNLVINPSAATSYALEEPLDVDHNLTITTGTLDTKTGENNSINLEGSFTNAATFLARNGTVTFDDDQANSRTITSGGTSFYNLVINPSAATSYALEEPLDVDHNLTLSGGTLDTKSGENNAISVAGNWTNSATFTAQNGTVTFNGSASQNITTGSSNWYELTITNSSLAGVSFLDKFTCNSLICTTPNAHLNFKFKSVANEKFEITSAGGLHLEGADSQPIVLRRYLGAVGDHWDIYPSGDSWTVSYVDVQDSINSYPLYINPSHSTDSGNNYNWFTQETCVVQPYPATSILGSGSLIYFSASNAGSCASDPSYLWNVASVIGSAINVDGIYASGNNDTGAPATDTVTVTDSANGIIGTASVCVGKVDCELSVSPSSKTVSSGEAIQLSATESAGCDLAASYSWKVESTIGSSVNASGLYTAGTNNTLSNISETVTITDSTNCAVATATITVKGIRVTTTTTIPITPTTTTSIPETTTTTVPVTPTTTTTPITCALAVNPQLASVNPSDTVTFTASELGECDSPDYEWAILTNTDSSLTPAGTTCIYRAGKNEGTEPFTDIITVTDSAHGNISANARVTIKASEPPPSIVVMPNLMLRSHLIALPVLMFIYGTNTHFHQVNPTITFNSSNSVFALPPLAIDDATIISLIFVMPSWFTGSEEETVTVTTITGSEVSSTTLDIEMLPLILEEERQ